ncbi:MAG: MarR family transcriptional regulator, partial [Pseudomonadota bacterium]
EVGIIQQLSRALFEARLPDGVTVPHFSVLNHLIRVGDGRTPLELARAFQTPKASMTNTLAGLEKRDLIEMRPHPTDGRSKQVWLTEAGRTFRDEAIGALVPDILALSDQIDLKALAELTPRLTEIRKVLDENRR